MRGPIKWQQRRQYRQRQGSECSNGFFSTLDSSLPLTTHALLSSPFMLSLSLVRFPPGPLGSVHGRVSRQRAVCQRNVCQCPPRCGPVLVRVASYLPRSFEMLWPVPAQERVSACSCPWREHAASAIVGLTSRPHCMRPPTRPRTNHPLR